MFYNRFKEEWSENNIESVLTWPTSNMIMWSGTGSTKLYWSAGVLLECWHTIRDIAGAKLHLHAVRGSKYITWFFLQSTIISNMVSGWWGSNSNYEEERWCYLAATTTAGSYDVFISVWPASNIYWRGKKLVIDDLEFTHLLANLAYELLICNAASYPLGTEPRHCTRAVRQTKARSTVGAALAPKLQDWVSLHVFLLLHADSADIHISNLMRSSTRSKLKTRTMECSSLTIEI